MARIAYGLYKGRFLNAVSVGFIPLRWENGDEKSTFQRRYIEQELLEVSAVGIPANPNALQLALKEGAIDKADIRAFAELLAEIGGVMDCPQRNSRQSPIGRLLADIKTLLALVRQTSR